MLVDRRRQGVRAWLWLLLAIVWAMCTVLAGLGLLVAAAQGDLSVPEAALRGAVDALAGWWIVVGSWRRTRWAAPPDPSTAAPSTVSAQTVWILTSAALACALAAGVALAWQLVSAN